MVKAAGLDGIVLDKRGDYIASMKSWKDPMYAKVVAALPEDDDLGRYVTSLYVSAVKPAADRCC